MDQSLLVAAAGMRAHLETLELLGNNIANASTTGYKADQEFYRLFMTAQAQADPQTGQIGWMPVVAGSEIDFRQGPLLPTESPLDVALSGPGFLVVEGPAGRLYTRNGNLRLSPDGTLQTSDARPVLDAGNRPIVLPPGAKTEISRGGAIVVDGLEVARLALVEFEGRLPVSKAGQTLFQAAANVEPRPATGTLVHQGRLEGSNVNPSLAAVRLIQASRNFEMLSRVATLVGEDIDGRAVEELGSSGS